MNFWKTLREKKYPILGLSPMDGVTDSPFRRMICETASPDVLITEFVNVEGLARGAIKMLDDFVYSEQERPVVAQIYGIELDSFYIVAFIACRLGFDGIDINMGCPAKKVEQRGAGAGLIHMPHHAQNIIKIVKKAVTDYANGKTLEEADVRPKVIVALEKMHEKYPYMNCERKQIPVSVKTRMGIDEIIAEHWIQQLLEEEPDCITLHGRTLKQRYMGDANWEVIKKAGDIIKKNRPETVFLGNGDISSRRDALERIEKSGIDGALIGRATFGNPWFFSETEIFPSERERKEAAYKHCKIFEEMMPHRKFFIMRKHLGWYMKEFSGSRELRGKLMRADSSDDVKSIIGLDN